MITIESRIGVAAVLAFCAAIGGCQGQPGKIVGGAGQLGWVDWTEDQLAQPMAIVTLQTTEHASYHVARFAPGAAEKPHVHERHDLTVSILRGAARVHLGDTTVAMGQGDVVIIPHGLEHWVENISDGPTEGFATFTPPYDGKDSRPIETPH